MAGTQAWKEIALDKNMKPDEAAQKLREYGNYRTLREKLENYSHRSGDQLRDWLRDSLMAIQPDAKKDSLDRKLRMWYNGDFDYKIDRKIAVMLCFVMKLGLDDADDFVAAVTDEGLRWRDPDELPYIFAVMRGLSYQQAVELHEAVTAALAGQAVDEADDSSTMMIQSDVLRLQTRDELIDYVKVNAGMLGKSRRTALKLFTDMLEILEDPYTSDYTERSKAGSVEEVLNTYLHRAVVPTGVRSKAGKQDAREKVIQSVAAAWPDKTTISRMLNGERPVTRKVLMLLFVATNGYNREDEEDGYYSDVDEQDTFEDAYDRMNEMLFTCGFRTIDPRSPFDWAIIYVLNAGDLLEIDEQMEKLLESLFHQPKDDGEE